MINNDNLKHDQFIAFMVAERDAELHGRGPVRVISLPDDENLPHKTVELVASDNDIEIVVEHTRIESYDDQVDDHATLRKIFPHGGPVLPDRDDAAAHAVWFHTGDLPRVPFKQRSHVASIITEWTAENVDNVPWPHTPGQPINIVGSHPDVPFRWGLARLVPPDIGFIGPTRHIVGVSFIRPDDLEERRARRLARSLHSKLPKLLAAARSTTIRRRSLLVLEDRDTNMSAPFYVSRALETISTTDNELPDAIYLLNTRVGDPLLCSLWDGQTWAHDHDDFRWLTFAVERASHFNIIPVDWI